MKKRFIYLFILFLVTVETSAQVFIPFGFWNCKNPVAMTGDSLNADFLLGSTSNTTVSGAGVVLSAGQTSGTFTSRVFDLIGNCTSLSDWLSVSWKGSLPYGKLLPDYTASIQNETIADYSGLASSTFMNSIMASWHFQETATGTAPGGKDFQDYSGTGTHGTLFGGLTLNAAGKIGRAITFNGTNAYINFGTPANITGVGNFSISFWIYPNSITTAQTIIYRSDNNAQQGFWVTQSATGQIRFQMIYATANSLTQSTNTLPLSTWTHVVINSDGSLTGNNSKIYFNGIEVAYTGNSNGSGAHSSVITRTLFVGQPGSGTAGFLNGRLQELSFMSRQLTAAEIIEEYRRGINRVKMQFRSCILSDCSDLPPWLGPDGTNMTFYSEINNNRIPSTWLSHVFAASPIMIFGKFPLSSIPNNRYFQYKATLETDNLTYAPDLKAVTIRRQ